MKQHLQKIIMIGLMSLPCRAQEMKLVAAHREPQDINHYHWSLWGNYQYRQGNIKPAAYWYAKILADNPSPHALHGYVTALYKSRNYPAIVKLIPVLDNAYADQRDMQLIFAQALLYTGNILPAHKKFTAMYEKNKTHGESAYFAAESYSRMKEYDKALEVVDTYLQHSHQQHTDFLFHFLKAQIYAVQRQVTQAREHVQKALEMNPRFEQGILFMQLLDKIEQEMKRSGNNAITWQAFKKYVPDVQKQTQTFYQTEKTIYFSHL